jgi:hypothetical protein
MTPLLLANIGLSQDNPIIPTSGGPGTWIFSGVTRGRWFDPPTAYGFEYTMLNSGDLFTEIVEFPAGFSNLEVFVGTTSLGLFNPGYSLTFPVSGVSSFRIVGLEFDSENPVALPLNLYFNNETASFSMTALTAAVPEPGSLALCTLGAATFLGVLWRCRRQTG